MKAFNRFIIIFGAIIILLFVLLNVWLFNTINNDVNTEYKVEVNRTTSIISNQGLEAVDLSEYEYIIDIKEYSDNDFYNSQNEYIIKDINGVLYRFDYINNTENKASYFVIMNVSLSVITILSVLVLIYIRQRIIVPFNQLQEIPYELSKGNLIIPLKEDENRYFGRFIWGTNLLRENIEEQKAKELELQKEKKTLLLSLSHDIKTPLSAIKLYSQALSKGIYENKDKQKEIAQLIDQNVNEIEAYVTQIVTASREDFLSLEVNNSEFYINDLIDSIDSYYKEKLSLINTEFTINKYDNCFIKGDLNRSIEVLQNIIENAIKYGDGKSIEINIYEEDGAILIGVKNSGNSMNESELTHIFESFYRGSNVGNNKGSGLGLYICRELMHKMNGDIFANIDNGYMIITTVFTKI